MSDHLTAEFANSYSNTGVNERLFAVLEQLRVLQGGMNLQLSRVLPQPGYNDEGCLHSTVIETLNGMKAQCLECIAGSYLFDSVTGQC